MAKEISKNRPGYDVHCDNCGKYLGYLHNGHGDFATPDGGGILFTYGGTLGFGRKYKYFCGNYNPCSFLHGNSQEDNFFDQRVSCAILIYFIICIFRRCFNKKHGMAFHVFNLKTRTAGPCLLIQIKN